MSVESIMYSPGILLVDDDPEDARLLVRALRKINPNRLVHHVLGGVEALAFLRDSMRDTETGFPGIVLLDLNMPGMNGIDTLSAIRTDPQLRRVPVFMWSTSSASRDVVESFDAGASAFVTKPSGMTSTREVLGRIEDFWFDTCALPFTPRGAAPSQ
jgi:CheY-like chemotaxis protein